jgi:hypothetical protein
MKQICQVKMFNVALFSENLFFNLFIYLFI